MTTYFESTIFKALNLRNVQMFVSSSLKGSQLDKLWLIIFCNLLKSFPYTTCTTAYRKFQVKEHGISQAILRDVYFSNLLWSLERTLWMMREFGLFYIDYPLAVLYYCRMNRDVINFSSARRKVFLETVFRSSFAHRFSNQNSWFRT